VSDGHQWSQWSGTKFGQLIIRKIIEIVAARSHILGYNTPNSISEDERKKRISPFSTTPLLFEAPLQRMPANIRINPILLDTRIPGPTFAPDNIFI